MNGMEAIKAMMEGKTVVVTVADGNIVDDTRYRINNHGVLVRGIQEISSNASMNAFLASEFEVVPEYPLNFFEAMEALNKGETVMNDYYELKYMMDAEGNVILAKTGGRIGFAKEEITAKWKIVEE